MVHMVLAPYALSNPLHLRENSWQTSRNLMRFLKLLNINQAIRSKHHSERETYADASIANLIFVSSETRSFGTGKSGVLKHAFTIGPHTKGKRLIHMKKSSMQAGRSLRGRDTAIDCIKKLAKC